MTSSSSILLTDVARLSDAQAMQDQYESKNAHTLDN